MPPRPRYDPPALDEEKIRIFSKKFEETDPLDEEQPFSPEEIGEKDERAKKAFYRFAEIDEPREEKKHDAKQEAKMREMMNAHSERHDAKEGGREADRHHPSPAEQFKLAGSGSTVMGNSAGHKVIVAQSEETTAATATHTPAHSSMTASSASSPPEAKPTEKQLSKAEAQALQQYQAKLVDTQQVKIRRPILTGFLIGIGILLFFIMLLLILFSIAVIMGVSVGDLLLELI